MPIIVVSKEDIAGQTILKQLLKHFNFKEHGEFEGNPKYKIENNIELIITNKRLIFSDHLDSLKTDLLIFGSRHASQSEKPSLLVHSTGNWTEKADFGGNPKELAIAPAFAIKEALFELKNQKEKLDLSFDVSLEVSHHGPTNLSTPLVFIELGSNEHHWKNELGAEAVANAIMKVAHSKNRYKTVIGFGGTHYCPNFNRLVLNSEIASSHIAPKYVLNDIDDMIEKAVKRTKEKVDIAVLDWKGMNSKQKNKIKNKLEGINLEYCKLNELL
ncbi:MAG: D-aminoacyl-tRNA deacylase [Candidatus Helarchaeota archaeon]